MRALVTGMGGTVGPAVAARLRDSGAEVIRWDRGSMPIESEADVRRAIESARADWVCHIATGPVDWAGWVARACSSLGVRLLWTGSVSVFGETARPPLTPETPPDATDDYGRYKIECERRVRAACADAIVARLGWQIGLAPGSNTMTDYLAREAAKHSGVVRASRRWAPSCAFLEDTASAIASLMERGEPGIYHLEGNGDGMSLFDLALGLRARFGMPWEVAADESPARCNLMQDSRVVMGQVRARLGCASA